MRARYGSESSSLAIRKVLKEFPGRLLTCFCKRIVLKKFIYDLTMESFYLLFGLPMLLAGMIYGGFKLVFFFTGEGGPPPRRPGLSPPPFFFGFPIFFAPPH